MLKTVIFDLGNVLVYFSHRRLFQQVGALMDWSGDDLAEFIVRQGILHQIEDGSMSVGQLIERLSTAAGKPMPVEKLLWASSDIFWPNVFIRPIVHELKRRGIRLVLLSNTCEPHVLWLEKHDTIFQLFDDHIFSCRAKLAKPDPRIFQLALEKAQCDPTQCFYADDLPDNIAAAQAQGLPGGVFSDTVTFKKQLAEHGITDLP